MNINLMKKLSFVLVLLCLSVSDGFARNRKCREGSGGCPVSCANSCRPGHSNRKGCEKWYRIECNCDQCSDCTHVYTEAMSCDGEVRRGEFHQKPKEKCRNWRDERYEENQFGCRID